MVRRALLLNIAVMALLLVSSRVALADDIQCMDFDVMGFCVGTSNPDIMTGTDEGRELMFGLGGSDVLRGLGASDSLDGGTETDTLDGGAGNDGYIFQLRPYQEWGNDTIADSAGIDALDFGYIRRPFTQEGVTVDLIPRASQPEAFLGLNTVDWPSTVSIENVHGTLNDDFIRGTNGDNILTGEGSIWDEDPNASHDIIEGRGGNDRLHGGVGNDQLNGGPGRDTITADGKHSIQGPIAGNDLILAVDNESDAISCGPGFDTVLYDYPQDRFFRVTAGEHCEDKRPHFVSDPRG